MRRRSKKSVWHSGCGDTVIRYTRCCDAIIYDVYAWLHWFECRDNDAAYISDESRPTGFHPRDQICFKTRIMYYYTRCDNYRFKSMDVRREHHLYPGSELGTLD